VEEKAVEEIDPEAEDQVKVKAEFGFGKKIVISNRKTSSAKSAMPDVRSLDSSTPNRQARSATQM